jgi:hypothetical protein
VPAYANAPRRSGLLLALAGIVALAAAAALAIFLFGATAPPMTAGSKVQGDEAKQAMAAAKAALDEASRSVLQPPAPSAPATEPPAPTQAPPPSADSPKAETPPPASAEAPKAEPAAPPPTPEMAAAARAPDKAQTVAKAEPPKTAVRPPPAKAASPVTEPPKTLAAAPVIPAPAEVPKTDRWDQMKAEMAQCSSGSLIPRIQCEQRIRSRYCEGYWGSVPACPTGRTDHGN